MPRISEENVGGTLISACNFILSVSSMYGIRKIYALRDGQSLFREALSIKISEEIMKLNPLE